MRLVCNEPYVFVMRQDFESLPQSHMNRLHQLNFFFGATVATQLDQHAWHSAS